MTESLFTVLRYLLAVGVGIVIGVVFSSGRVKVRGKPVVIPYINRTNKNFTLVVVLLLLSSVVAVANTSVQANRQAACNQEFRRVITENSQLSAESAALQDKLWAELSGFLTTPPVVSPEEAAPQPQIMDVTPQQIGESINQYLTEREQAKAARQNYPDAKCDV